MIMTVKQSIAIFPCFGGSDVLILIMFFLKECLLFTDSPSQYNTP